MAWTPQSIEKGVPVKTILGAFGTNRCKKHAFENNKHMLKTGVLHCKPLTLCTNRSGTVAGYARSALGYTYTYTYTYT